MGKEESIALVKSIIYEEFSKLIVKIEGDFGKNYVRKKNNFLLNQLDDNVLANMVFVSSFESKSGNAIEACAQRIARIRFGDNNVPRFINPNNIQFTPDPKWSESQIIISDINFENSGLVGDIANFRERNVGTASNNCSTNPEAIKSLHAVGKKYQESGHFYGKPVDLCLFNGKDWVVMELKAGGDLDTSNAPKNVEKLLTLYTGLNVENSKAYFVALYNKNGEGKNWTGILKKHLSYPDMFLIGKDFWEYILPDGISFSEFTKTYKEALTDIDLNARIKKMISNASH
jgi:hypothetical protein